ncbi:MAG: winged helix-turn-helix transcriptional regulator [Nitrososphaerota archaeon]|jgi:transposase|nr:winged helix-turn-helix transcriptional regulator [Nitrososphaerota archaeon]
MCPQILVPTKIENYVQTKQVISNKELAQTFNITETTAMNYLSRLAKTGQIKNISKGTYQIKNNKQQQTTKTPLPQDLQNIVNQINTALPMTKITTWSLQIIANYTHYMIGKDLIFIETTKTLSNSIRDLLISKGYHTVLLPEKRDYQEYALYPQTPVFILERKETYGLIQLDNYSIPTMERLWADIYYYSTRKGLTFDSFELGLIFVAMVEKGVINFDRLLRYSARRGCFNEILLFLYELRKQNTKLNQILDKSSLFGRQEIFKVIDAMVEGAKTQ